MSLRTQNKLAPVIAQSGEFLPCRQCGADAVRADSVELGTWVFGGQPCVYVNLECRACAVKFHGVLMLEDATTLDCPL